MMILEYQKSISSNSSLPKGGRASYIKHILHNKSKEENKNPKLTKYSSYKQFLPINLSTKKLERNSEKRIDKQKVIKDFQCQK